MLWILFKALNSSDQSSSLLYNARQKGYPKGLNLLTLILVDLSKDNIVSRRFSKKAFGGLDEFEVRDFLHVLAEEIRHLEQLVFNQKKRLTEQDEQVKEYRDREHILKKSISSAQEIADKIRKDTENQGQLLLKHAHEKAEFIIQEARASLQCVYSDINDLKRLYLQFKTSLKASLQSHLEFLEQDSFMMSPLPREQKSQERLEETSQKTNTSEITEDDFPSIPKDSAGDLNSLKDSLRSLDTDL